MRLFKGKNTYNQHVSVSDNEKNCTILTAHECNREDDNEINGNSTIGTNNCSTPETADTGANRSKERIPKNDQNYKEKKESVGGVQVDKNGE